jgi:hypothetical protein
MEHIRTERASAGQMYDSPPFVANGDLDDVIEVAQRRSFNTPVHKSRASLCKRVPEGLAVPSADLCAGLAAERQALSHCLLI